MRIVKKGTPLLLAKKYSRKARPQGGQLNNPHNEDCEERRYATRSEEPILVTKLQKIHRKRSPPTRRTGSVAEMVDPCKPTRKLLSLPEIVKVIDVTD
ncbi:unnamed protein product [Prunus armeniaca]